MRAPWLAAALVLLAFPAAAGIGLPIGSSSFSTLDCAPACNRQVTTTQGPANEVTVAVNPRDALDLVAAAKDYTLGPISTTCGLAGPTRVWAGLYDSHDGGRTWRDQLLPRDGPLARYIGISDPALAFGADGAAYYAGLGLRDDGGACPTEVFVERSLDGGATWSFLSVVASNFTDKPAIAVDPFTNRIYASWVTAGDPFQGIGFAWSDDGLAWTHPVETLPWSTLVPYSMGPAIGVGPPSPQACGLVPGPPAHPVYVVYVSLVTGIPSTLVTCDSGATWLPLPPIPALSAGTSDLPVRAYRSPPMPTIGVIQGGLLAGTVVEAYLDLGQSRGEVRVARLPLGAPGWVVGPPELPVDPGAGPFGQPIAADDTMPALAIGPRGDVHVAHYTTRYASCAPLAPLDCLRVQGSQLDERVGVAYHHSADGVVWDAPVRLTTAQSDPELSHHQTGAVFLGDYIGLAATDDRANAVWTDTRTGRADVFEATVLR